MQPETINKELLNLLEPEGLVHAFMTEPPECFEPIWLEANGRHIPGFLAEFDLFTTADKKVRGFYERHKGLLPSFIKRFLKPEVVFIGTTVSEYALFPYGIEPKTVKESVVSKLNGSGLQFLIIKDIPLESYLLSEEENKFSRQLIFHLKNNGFFVLYGQALAYVPVNFSSIEEYLQRFSRSRRKDLKRKLRSFSEVSIEQVKTGADFFTDFNIDLLYDLYLNVYEKSRIHFDKLTLSFFKKVFRDKNNGGIVFLYRHQDRIIGFNLCFIVRDYLVDKYVGFLYPDSHRFNLYFVSWFYNLNFCIQNNLRAFIAGWTDPEIKSYLGAEFTYTYHAVYIKNPLLRFILNRFKSVFESDKRVLEESKR
jgi:hypothetical protein